MKKTKLARITVAFSFCALLAANAQETRPLFDGKTFAGWDHQDSHWSIEDDALTGTIPDGEKLGRNIFLFSNTEVHDFVLELDYKITGNATANSGIQFRSIKKADGEAQGYQADLDDGATWVGRIYDESGRGLVAERGAQTTIGSQGTRAVIADHEPGWVKSLVNPGDWNHYTVRAQGSRMEISINGTLTTVLIDNELGEHDFSGSLGLQLHAGDGPAKVQFKNITLTDLGKTAPPEAGKSAPSLKPDGRAGIEPLGDNGKSLNLGFESGNLEGWTATGDAWEKMPLKGDTVSPRRPGMASEHVGEFWVGSYENGHTDTTKGTLTSAPFAITQPFASFFVGGGDGRDTRVEIALSDSGKTIHTASGAKTENLAPVLVDLSAYVGKKIEIRVIDDATGPWGHINFDDFRFHEKQPDDLRSGARPARLRNNPILQHLVKNPAAPEASSPAAANVANTYLPEGFQAELVAAEPDVRQPIAFTTDARGRLWVAEAFSYPQRQPEAEGKDRITIFSDEDGDGSFETRKVFTENLNLVSGLQVGFGGVWVGAAPQLLFIPDANDDDIPDGEPQVLLDGWGYQDTHETLNSFIWGPDGWLYGNQGVFNSSRIGKPGAPDADRITLNAGVWRYHPTRHTFEIFAHGGSNQWGLDFDKYGEAFMTHCRSFWGGGSTTHVIQHGYYWNQANARRAPFVSTNAPDDAPYMRNLMLASAQYGHGEGGAGKPGSKALYGGHSHVGTMIYQGTNWPAEYRDGLFTHNLHGHQINHEINRPLGSGYETIHSGQDFAFVDAPDYVAVDLQANHDGAVYIIDWADTQHCHSPNMETWDRSNGRIVRISYTATYKPTKINFTTSTDAELVGEVASKNEWSSRTVRRLLQERAATGALDKATLSPLSETARSENPEDALRALWTLSITGTLTPESLDLALGHAHPRVRAWAVRLGTGNAPASEVLFAKFMEMAKSDPSPVVRLTLASYISEAPDKQAWPLANALSSHAEDSTDRNLPNLIYFGIAPRFASDLDQAFAFAESAAQPHLRDFSHWYLATLPKALSQSVSRLAEMDGTELSKDLSLLSFALGNSTRSLPEAWKTVAPRLYDHADTKVRADARHVGAIFSDEFVLTELRRTLADSSSEKTERRHAFDTLSQTTDRSSFPSFLKLLDDPEYRADVIPLLARYDETSVGPALIRALANLPDPDRSAAINTLATRPSTARLFLEAIRDGKADRKYLTAFQVRQLRNLGDEEVTKLAGELFGIVRESAADKLELIAKISKTYHEAQLWAFSEKNGKELFGQICATCHAINGEGGKLGPDLAGSGTNGLDYFLESIVDPNAVVGTDFQLNMVTKKDGAVVAGVVQDETKDSITLRTLADPVMIPTADIAKRQQLESSLMPEGLLPALSERQQIELLKYLISLK